MCFISTVVFFFFDEPRPLISNSIWMDLIHRFISETCDFELAPLNENGSRNDFNFSINKEIGMNIESTDLKYC